MPGFRSKLKKVSESFSIHDFRKVWPRHDHPRLLYRGKFYPVRFERGPRLSCEFQREAFVFTSEKSPRLEDSKKILTEWIKPRFQADVRELLKIYLPQIKKPAREFRIRPYKSLWGSCDKKGLIRLNFFLSFLPVEALEYVIVHELCHLEHMNHSRDFWARVASLFPQYKVQQKVLKKYSAVLHEL